MQPRLRGMRAVEQGGDSRIGLRVARKSDDGIARDLRDTRGPARPCDLRARDEGERIGHQRQAQCVGRHYRADEKGEIEFLHAQALAQVGGDIDFDLEREQGKARLHRLEELREPGVNDGFGDAQPQHAARGRDIADGRQHFRAQAEQLLGVDQQFAAARRRRGDARVARQDARAKRLFEAGDALGNGGLCRVELAGGGAERPECGHPVEGFDLLEVEHVGLRAINAAYRNLFENTIGLYRASPSKLSWSRRDGGRRWAKRRSTGVR